MDEYQDDFLTSASIATLQLRAKINQRVRQFFDQRDFFEVETPLLSHDTVIDRYLHPIALPKNEVTGVLADKDQKLWLQTSPEFGMKRLVASGATAIYQICKAFRQSESGGRHNPEFTMLEWYRVGDDLHSGMNLLSDFVIAILERPKPKRVTYREVFQDLVDVDPFTDSVAKLCRVIQDHGITVEFSDNEANRDGCLNVILSELIEPKLGWETPVIIYDWPASQAALSIVRSEAEFKFAERFELYLDGLELANGYHELKDPEELRRRNSITNQLRLKDGNSLLPEESRLLSAMASQSSDYAGVALGMDRLVMAMSGAETIGEVVSFPVDSA